MRHRARCGTVRGREGVDTLVAHSGYGGVVAMFATMLRRDRERNGLRIARASWLIRVTMREYREIEAGTKPPGVGTTGVSALFGWPGSFTDGAGR